MSKLKNLPHSLTTQEKWLGVLYLIFELFFLPSALYWLNGLLITPLSAAWLNLVYFGLNFVFVWLIFKGFLKKSLIYTGKHKGDFLLAMLLGFVLYQLCSFAVGLCIRWLLPSYTNLNDSSIAGLTAGNFTIMALGTMILVPLVEETLHRGLIFGTLYKKHKAAAYIVSALIFAVIHVMSYVGVYQPLELVAAIVQYLPAGLILAWAYAKSGSIYAPMLIHILVNALGIFTLR